jgi:integral membrane protein
VSLQLVRLAVRAYRTMAYVTGTMLCILVFICIPLQVWAHNNVPVEIVGTLHGILYIIYIVIAFAMTRAVRMKVASPGTIIVLAAGTIPVLTFVVERWVSRTYIVPALDRAAPNGAAPGEAAAGEQQPVLR